MPLLNKEDIAARIARNELLLKPARDETGAVRVEPASYDLRAGVVLWKEDTTEEIKEKVFDEVNTAQDSLVTLKPGQMVFVLTHEDLKLPVDVAGTVYSRNKLQKKNILALNAGHIDPGYQGPVLIRLINLGANPWSIRLGEAVFTVTFHTVMASKNAKGHAARTREEMLEVARNAAENAFSNPFHDLYKTQIENQLGRYYSEVEDRLRKSFSDEFFRKKEVSQFGFAFLIAILTIILLVTKLPWKDVWDYLKENRLNLALIIIVFGVIIGLIIPWAIRVWRALKGRRRKKNAK
jgi:deoxycytidine triphosphate deaminase